jgi:hypothetical protein
LSTCPFGIQKISKNAQESAQESLDMRQKQLYSKLL